MEASKVNTQLKYLSQVAVTLSSEERMQLEYAFEQLQTVMSFENVYFWGKITGKSPSFYLLTIFVTSNECRHPERLLYCRWYEFLWSQRFPKETDVLVSII